jgi:hypothetical protein
MAQRGLTVFRWSWITFLVVLTSAPYLINWWSTPPGHQFTWIIPPYPQDSFGYRTWAQQAAHGAWLFKIKYTALPHSAFLFNPFFLICGWISALLRLDIGVLFLVVKAMGTVLLLATFYRYTDYLRLNPTQSVAAAILLGVSSGLGGILAVLGFASSPTTYPADLWMPEMSTFWSLLWNPLFPWSLTLMLLSIFWIDRGTAEERVSDLWRSGLATGVMALVHPYSLPLLFTMPVIIAVVRMKTAALRYLFRYFAAAAPFAIYLIITSRTNALVAKHSVMGEMKSPPIAGYLLGFGFPLLLFIVGVVMVRGALVKRYWQLILWFLLSILFAYFPFWFQRKLVFGAHIPLSILAGVALDLVFSKWSIGGARRVATAVATVVVLLPFLIATPTYLLISQYQKVNANADGAYFVNNEIMEGLKILQQRSRPEDVVFAAYATSRLIPAFSGNTVVWGHWAMSMDLKERQTWSMNVFSAQSDERRSAEFWGGDIQFVFADGEVKQWFENHPFMAGVILRDANKIFENSSVVIYQRPGASL